MKRIISLICCALLSVFAMGGCADNGEPFSSKTYTVDGAQIKSISIDVRDRQIEVSPSEDHQIHIDYFENDKEYYDISVSDESVLTITAADSKEWSDYIGGKAAAEYRKISVRIPDALLQSLTVSTTNEEIVLSELAVTDSVSLSSNGGNIRFAKLTVGREIALTAKNGDISGTVVGSCDDFAIRSAVKKGESNLPEAKDGGEKSLNVSCNNGDISIAFQAS